MIIADSLNITQYLDSKFPERPLIPSNAVAFQSVFEMTFNRVVGPILGRMILPLAWRLLDERSRVFFCESRERWRGGKKAMKRWRPEVYITDKEWNTLKDALDDMAMLVDQGRSEPYIAGGEVPTRADLLILSGLASLKTCAPDKWEQEIVHWSGGRWARLWQVSEAWRGTP
jgi:glutathione S-transferase